MKITILVDNYSNYPNILAEYGLSIHIRDEEKQVLLDTGQGHALVYNSAVLGISLKEIDHLVLSHGHYDHTGGVSDFLLNSRKIPIWAHPEIKCGHTKLREEKPFFNGCCLDSQAAKINPVRGVTQITENIWAVEIPMERREPEFVNQVPYLVVPGGEDWVPDPFIDDISLVVKGKHGLSVILGCSHAGVVNIIQEISRQFDTKKFYSVLGGMHLGVRSSEYIDKILSELIARFRVQKWRPCHCTGLDALVTFALKVKDVSWAGAGCTIDL
jgi:7,8-dihydropterin-6-yl-methyl-4-(beta-D-ribofuranosyl)aminobenzene 5'-phosphate synthase